MVRTAAFCFAVLCLATGVAHAADALAPMKFNDIREVAPGVFFSYSAISPTDPSIFAGCNNIWVVFEDYVVVIDANFPKEARDVLAAIRKTTDKPIRYVQHVHAEMTGQTMPWELTQDFGTYEGPSPTKDSPSWTRARRIIVPNLMPCRRRTSWYWLARSPRRHATCSTPALAEAGVRVWPRERRA